MALKSYSKPRPTKWVTIGGTNKAGEANPTNIKGYYRGSITGPNPFDEAKTKTDFVLRVGNEDVGVSGSANLIRQFMEQEEGFQAEHGRSALGSWVEIHFTGLLKSTKKGRNPMKLFTVGFDDENIMPDGLLATSPDVDEDEVDSDDENDSSFYDGSESLETRQPVGVVAKSSNTASVLAKLKARNK
jgi:hypothetical protein